MRWLCTMLLLAVAATAVAAEPDASGISDKERGEGFVPIFDGCTLDNWQGLDGLDGYYVQDGMLICKRDAGYRKHIFTKKEYADFILRFEFKLEPGGNNGVGIRTKVSATPHIEGMEIQVLDEGHERYHNKDFELAPYQYHGSIYGVVPSKPGHLKPAGEWNEEEIRCVGRRVTVTLNGTVIVDADLDKIEKPFMDGKEHPGLYYTKGRIGLHAHGGGEEVYFRNLRVKEL